MAGGRQILGRSLDFEAFLDGQLPQKMAEKSPHLTYSSPKRRQEVYSLHPEAGFWGVWDEAVLVGCWWDMWEFKNQESSILFQLQMPDIMAVLAA